MCRGEVWLSLKMRMDLKLKMQLRCLLLWADLGTILSSNSLSAPTSVVERNGQDIWQLGHVHALPGLELSLWYSCSLTECWHIVGAHSVFTEMT